MFSGRGNSKCKGTKARKNLPNYGNKQLGLTGVKSKPEGGGRRQTQKEYRGQSVNGL